MCIRDRCTTGLSEEQLAQVAKASESTAVLRSANMSLGINTLLKLVQEAAKVLAGAGFDMEIVEKHHNQKVDAPSGTALALACLLYTSRRLPVSLRNRQLSPFRVRLWPE